MVFKNKASTFKLATALIALFASYELAFAEVKAAQPLSSASTQLKIAVVDVQSAILQTNEGKSAKAKIEKEVEAKRQELLAQQNELKKLEEDFQAQQSILSDADKMAKQKEFQLKLQKLQSSQVGFEQETRQKELSATNKIYQNLIGIVQRLAKQKGFELAFDRGAGVLLYADKVTDITAEVIAQYNIDYKGQSVKEAKK